MVSALVSLALAEGVIRAVFWTKGIGRRDVREILQRSRIEGPVYLDGGSGLLGLVQASDYEDIVYELKPRLEGIFKGKPLRVNSHGFRGPEVPVRKPHDVLRVVGLGDSHMFGWGVSQEDSYLAVLERLLNERSVAGKRWQVLNFAVPGYDTVMEVATLERRALAFDPDVVVIHFVGNDMLPPHFLQEPRGFAPSHWYLVELVRGLLGPVDDHDVEMNGEARPAAAQPTPRDYREEFGRHEHFVEAMDRLARVTRERRIPVILLILGEGTRLRRFVCKVAADRGFQVLDAAPYFWEKLDAMGFARTRRNWRVQLANGVDKHPREAGHEAYAEALAHEIQEIVSGG